MISIDEFLAKNSSLVNKRENIFEKYKDEILELREKGATLKLIVMYLTENYQDVKEKYKNEKTAIAFLSKTIRRWTNTINKSNTKQSSNTNSSIKKDDTSNKDDVKNSDTKSDKGGEDVKSVEDMMNSNIGADLFNKYKSL